MLPALAAVKLKIGFMRNNKNVHRYHIGKDTIKELPVLLSERPGNQVILIDHYFKTKRDIIPVDLEQSHLFVHFIDSSNELTTTYVNEIHQQITERFDKQPTVIVGIGGGTALDFAKAVANLLTNEGKAEQYQGWDLVPNPGIYKIGVPTLSGTGAESSRTCVMINTENGLKLGMNSDHTIYDQLILDPVMTATVPRNQYFYTGMDTFIHCFESLSGSHRHAISDGMSELAMSLCQRIFASEDMMSLENREQLMVASYMGGVAIANSFVGVVHPFSAGLSVVLGIHHCEANCITMRAMEEFYPDAYKEFWKMAESQGVEIPSGVCDGLSDDDFDRLYDSTVIHEKPLKNALGEDFKTILTKDKVKELFKKM